MSEQIKDDANSIIKAFENDNVTIIHETENNKNIFLFKASDIGKILDITNIRQSIINFDDDEKGVREAYTLGGKQKMLFLTSSGVYRFLYASKKPVAKQFRKWVGTILDDIIFNNSNRLKEELDKRDKEFKEQLMLKEEEIEEVRSENNWLHIANKKNVNFHKQNMVVIGIYIGSVLTEEISFIF